VSKPEDKPSFFDPSDEASSWPPTDSYEPDDETDNQENSLTDINYTDDDFLVPTKQDQSFEPVTESEPELPQENELTVNQVEIVEEASKPVTEEVISPGENFNVDDLFDNISDSKVEPDAQVRNQDADNVYSSSKFSGAPSYSIDDEQELKPFRTYTPSDYNDIEVPAEENAESTISNLLTKVNRNVLILAVVVIAIGIYFLVTTITNRNDYGPGRERAPRQVKKIAQELRGGERIPVWEISSQKTITELRDAQITKAIFESSGRENPFAIPDSILADYRKAAEIAAVKQQGPNTYKRIAYRALLVGVLTSKDSTVALIDVQEAAFDVVEGTGKTKILQLAVKAMDKAKKNTQEMVVGSYVGPWAVTKIEAAKNTYSEAKVTIEYGTQRKVLSMGKAEELGIFDEQGNIDNLENPVENVNLDDFAW
jgi:hypothetical protein